MSILHARLSPSAADRWMGCPGSQILIESLKIQKSPSNRYSAEGSFAHDLRARCLVDGSDVAAHVGERGAVDGYEFEVTVEMAANLQPGIDHIRSMVDAGATLAVERSVDMRRWVPGGFGTADAILSNGNRLVVNDLKFGAGHAVSAENNRQLMIYALGAIDLLGDHETITLEIDQPRVASGSNSYTITLDDLRAFGHTVRAAATLANSADAERIPSDDACRWCPAKQECPEFSSRAIRAAGFHDRSEWAPTAISSLTPAQKTRILNARDAITEWLDLVYAESLRDALAGTPIPGWKAVDGRRGARSWADPVAAEDCLVHTVGEKAYTRKLVSPAQAERLLGKKAAMPPTVQAEGKPCLVPDSDVRQATNTVAGFLDRVAKNHTNPWE